MIGAVGWALCSYGFLLRGCLLLLKLSVGRRPGGVVEDVMRALLPVVMPPTHVPDNGEVNYKLKRWQVDRRGKARYYMLELMLIGSR